MKSSKAKFIIRAGIAVAVLAAIAISGGVWFFHRHMPAAVMSDIQVAITVRNVADPDARLHQYLEGLYGSLDNPANRERMFKGFFDRNHIKAMQIIIKHSPPEQRQANIQAMIRVVADFRKTLSPQEKANLGAFFQSKDGQTTLQSATAQFTSQNAVYRSATVPVITELMTTLNTLRK